MKNIILTIITLFLISACGGGGSTYSNINNYKPNIKLTKYTNNKYIEDANEAIRIKINNSVKWKYLISNIGNETLTNIKLSDDKEGNISCPKDILSPNENMSCIKQGKARSGLYKNIATVYAKGQESNINIYNKSKSYYIGIDNNNSCIIGKIWLDENINGIQDENNPKGIQDIKLSLLDERHNVISYTTSNEDGQYSFCSLNNSKYYVKVESNLTALNYDISKKNATREDKDSDFDKNSKESDLIDLSNINLITHIDLGLYKYKNIVFTSSNQIEQLKNISNPILIKMNINSPKDIYLVATSHFDNQDISISSPSSSSQNSRAKVYDNEKDIIGKEPAKVINFNQNVQNLLHKSLKQSDKNIHFKITSASEGDTFNFCTDMDNSNNCSKYVQATARKVVKNISTKYGTKNLIVWVANDEYKDGILSSGSISQDMVNKLANQFLQNSDNNKYDDDIYDWDTNIYGAEWGDDASSIDGNLISNSDTINIFIYNMNSNGLAGYFWSKDNFKQSYIHASNEKIMFYINSKLYAQDEKETFTTLAHEFQHMIHFYQRNVKKGIKDSTWFDEMMSETTEDLLATKLKYHGPRNVDYRDGTAGSSGNQGGRFPTFNKYDYLSLTNWGNSLKDYSKVSSFGTFLLRNYGGAKILHNMMYSDSSDENAVLDAVKETDFNTLLNKWGEAVILSDIDDLDNSKPRYNFGAFKETNYDGITYKLGSINFFNYNPQPTMSSHKTVNKNANLYYKLGSNLSGTVKVNVNMQKGGDITIIAK